MRNIVLNIAKNCSGKTQLEMKDFEADNRQAHSDGEQPLHRLSLHRPVNLTLRVLHSVQFSAAAAAAAAVALARLTHEPLTEAF